MDTYNDKVKGRTAIGEALQTTYRARAVEVGLGLGCVSRVALQDAFRRGSLCPLAVPQRDFRRHFYFVLHRHKYRSAGMQRWLTLCHQISEISQSSCD